ncbi:hypothetical protein [Burkholderia thailandensis]|uniref:hypothetical protein n=1 Tax=Burkholderia thailandensis TaxID=57975 RepID=UPI0012DA09F0|nr:hypothetical protein [Burkholderia thailandensis]
MISCISAFEAELAPPSVAFAQQSAGSLCAQQMFARRGKWYVREASQTALD